MTPRILALGLVALCVSARGAGLIPIEDFARPPRFSDAHLSTDGRTCAFIREVDGRESLYFADMKTGVVKTFDLGHAKTPVPMDRHIEWYRWLGPKRVLVGIGLDGEQMEGTAAYDSDGNNWRPISGTVGIGSGAYIKFDPLYAYSAIYSFGDDAHALMLDQRDYVGEDRLFPHVVDVNTQTGTYEQVVKNPGNVISWLPDRNGVVRIGIERTKGKATLLYRDDSKSPWRPLRELEHEQGEIPLVLGFSSDGKGVFLAAHNKQHCRALYLCDLTTGALGEPKLELPGYDVEFHYSGPLIRSIWSDEKKAIVGYSYMTDGPRIQWFDERYAKNMAVVDRALPGTINVPIDISNQDRNMLIFSYSDRQPGVCYIYSPGTDKMEDFMHACPWIKPEQMAEMRPISYRARDGLEIHGYITIPVGQKARNLPLVVMPHGGPWVRDMWGYDPLVQLLANRGYAVFQMNYRGSTGYGAEFSRKGRKEVGGAIQRDIEDATRWAIDKRIADPKRIAIVGGSYGGYSAIYALGKSPDLYCCGISIAGVSDWLSIFKNLSDGEYKFAREHWAREIGDPETNEEKLKEISPINFADQIKAPLLIVHGRNDKIVPFKQAKKMAAALEKAGQKPETLYISDEGHGFRNERSRLAAYKAIEAFLAKHLGPGAIARAPALGAPVVPAEAAGKN